MSRIEDAVADAIRYRAAAGKNKYGVTMDRDDLSLLEWIQHAQEEAMDLAVYLEKIKQELHYQDEIDPEMQVYGVHRGPCVAHDSFSKETLELEEAMEKRMDIIGQNGNDGLHYDEANYIYDKTNWSNKRMVQSVQQLDNINVTYDIIPNYETKIRKTIQPGWNED